MTPRQNREFQALKENLRQGKPVPSYRLCGYMLQKVSRTFALNIRALGITVRRPVLLGYLFCRIADTVEDSNNMDVREKSRLLRLFYDIFNAESRPAGLIEDFKTGCRALGAGDDEEFLASVETTHPS